VSAHVAVFAFVGAAGERRPRPHALDRTASGLSRVAASIAAPVPPWSSAWAATSTPGCMQQGGLTLDVASRVARIGRVEPYTCVALLLSELW
jgi:hypothetical protein